MARNTFNSTTQILDSDCGCGRRGPRCSKEVELSIIKNDIKQLMKNPAVLPEDLTATYDVGGVHEGDTFLAGTTLASIIKTILAPDEPVFEGKLYYGVTDDIPSTITEDFESEELPKNVTSLGVTHYFTTTGKYGQIESFAYPSELGDLVHIYENDMTMFDLLDNFAKVIVIKDGINYNLYYGTELVKEEDCKYQFLWK